MKFQLGQVVATPGALEALQTAGIYPLSLLRRHHRGDWGDLCEEDKQANERAVESGLRILSSYPVGGSKVWVITEADRSSTTFLLPSEY